LQIGGTLEIYEVDTLAMVDETVKALKDVYSVYSAFDGHSIAVWMKPTEIRERLSQAGFVVNVINNRKTMLQPGEVDKKHDYILSYFISSKPRYSSIHFTIYAKSFDIAREVKLKLTSLFSDKKINGMIFGIRWFFMGGGGMQEAVSEEIFEDTLHNEAYPDIIAQYGSLDNFIDQYIRSDESILILQGPPGTGKTRLIRYVLARLTNAANKGKDVTVTDETHEIIYTGDAKLFESDGLFARFIVGDEKALVVEDADHVLESRANGNRDLHRFLTTSDGLISSTGRKLIFSTNLPNMNDVDEALVRPGRCFGRLAVRALTMDEAAVLYAKLMSVSKDVAQTTLQNSIDKTGKRETYSLAEIYKVAKNTSKH
jgi:hypothetical protein